jgi:hypothetical protein
MSEVTYTIDEDGKYACSCGNFTGSRSGWYKHKSKVHAVQHSPPKVEVQNNDTNVEEDSDSTEVDVEDSPSWMDFGMDVEDESTVHMPKPLKALHRKAVERKRGKMSKAEIQSLRDTSKGLLTMGLTFGDTLLSLWGRGQLLDPEFKVQHSDRDKELTADALVGAMEERGLYLANSVSRTAVAGVMLTWYFGVPTYQITKKSKKSLFKGGRGSGLLARIPLIGRLFRRKRRQVQVPVEEVEIQ